jgi:hypothetical protein
LETTFEYAKRNLKTIALGLPKKIRAGMRSLPFELK